MNHSTPLRGQLRFTDELLDSNLSDLEKLAVATVQYYGAGYISYDQFERVIPARRSAIVDALNSSRRGGWIQKSKPKRRRLSPKREACYYSLSQDANPRYRKFNILRLDIPLDASASRWLLRVHMDRLQAKAGLIQMPEEVLARKINQTKKAIRRAKEDWQNSGQLVTVRAGTRGNPAIQKLVDSYYAPDEDRFVEDFYSIRKAGPVRVWATADQHAAILKNLRHYDPNALDALSGIQDMDAMLAVPMLNTPTFDSPHGHTDFEFPPLTDGLMAEMPPPTDTDIDLLLPTSEMNSEKLPPGPGSTSPPSTKKPVALKEEREYDPLDAHLHLQQNESHKLQQAWMSAYTDAEFDGADPDEAYALACSQVPGWKP